MKHQKNIQVLVKYFYPVAAGIETNTMETYSVLAKNGWKVTFHTSTDTLIQKNSLRKNQVIRGLDVKRYRFHWYGFIPQLDWENSDLICLHNFDIFPHLWILLYSLCLKIVGKKSFALTLTPHGGFNPEWRIFKPWQAVIKRFYHYTLGAWLVNQTADAVRAVSEWEKQEMIKHGLKPELVTVISNGIEDEAYMDVEVLASDDIKQKVKQYDKYLINIGRIYMIKNYETVIRSLVKIPKNIKYVIAGPVGDEDYFDKLKKLIRELGLEERVIFCGVVRGVDKYYLIKHAQMMVHMAMWESFCNVVHEGMSQGLVCIVANNTALPLLVTEGKNGYLVETQDHQRLAEKINYVLDHQDSQEIIAMKSVNKEYGLQSSWRSVAEKMSQLYMSIIHKPLWLLSLI